MVIPYTLCYYINNKHYYEYKNDNNDNIIKKMIDNIINIIKKKVVIFVHNIEFDGRLIFDALSKNSDYILKSNIKNNSIYSITIIKDKKEIFIKCSYKLFPISLKKIAEDLNLDKKMVFPYKFVNKFNLNYIGEIPDKIYFNNEDEYNIFVKDNIIFDIKQYSVLYCKNDVDITIKFLILFNKILLNYDINIFNKKILSISSLSLNIFMKKFNKKNISLKMNKYDSYIRKSFFGGRCEIFGNIDINDVYTYHFDFSGMYGMCMKEKFCFGKFDLIYNNFDLTKQGFYDVEVTSTDMYIPILPHHNSFSHKLMFSNGTFRGIYWYEELNYFLKLGGKINNIYSALIYNNYDHIFNDFVTEFEKFREMGGSYKIFGKLIINSLYGRLAMSKSTDKTEIINIMNYNNYINNKNIISTSFFNNICLIKYEYKEEKNIYSNIAIASAIASKARIKLHKAFMSVIEKKGRIKYCDTDSVFASYDRCVDNEKHGEIFWDINKKDTKIVDALFLAPKAYAILLENNELKVKIKGIHNNNNISIDKLKENFFNNNILQFNNQLYFSKDITLKQKYNSKSIDLNKYNKRLWLNNKKDTKPYTYNYIDNTYQ